MYFMHNISVSCDYVIISHYPTKNLDQERCNVNLNQLMLLQSMVRLFKQTLSLAYTV